MNLPLPNVEPERYAGRPLLVFLEGYVLDCIGELAPDKQELIRTMVQKVFGGDSDWKLTMRQQLHLGETLDERIREMWTRNQNIVKESNTELHPVQFAKMFVDEDFADLIDPLPQR
jgi:hypothetical protein